jgi:hypothetical protein
MNLELGKIGVYSEISSDSIDRKVNTARKERDLY